MQGRREQQVFRNAILPAIATFLSTPLLTEAMGVSRSWRKICSPLTRTHKQRACFYSLFTLRVISNTEKMLQAVSRPTCRDTLETWYPNSPGRLPKIPMSSAKPAYPGIFWWKSSLLRMDQDGSASTQASDLRKASVPSNKHEFWDPHSAVSAESSWDRAQKYHECFPKGQSH